MEFEAVGLLGVLIIGGIGLLLIMYWTVRLTHFLNRQWPGKTVRVVFVTGVGFLVLFMGGWLIVTLLWPLVWIGNRRSLAKPSSIS